METQAILDVADIVTIVIYFVLVMSVGIIATIRANRSSTRGFFLAGKSMTFLPIAGSMFSTNFGAPMVVGLAGSAAANGFAPVMFEWHATFMMVLLGWIFVPIYFASGTYTMPEYLRKRFGGRRLQTYYAVVQLVLVALTGISAEIYAGSLFIQQLLGWNVYISITLILVSTAVYTIGGGLAAVMYTDAIQTVILIIGSVVLAVIALQKVGGYKSMLERFMLLASTNTNLTHGLDNDTILTEPLYSVTNLTHALHNVTSLTQPLHNDTNLTHTLYSNNRCNYPPADSLHIFRDIDSAFPWPGLVFGLTLLATYYWCTNQVMVQRNLAAKSVSHSKAACVVVSYLKLLPFFLFILPGMISRILYPDEIGCSDPVHCEAVCGNPAGCTNIAYPLIVLRALPTGLRGLMMAALLAALMSSLTSMFNSTSSVFTMDLWLQYRPKAKEREQILVGRLFGVLMICVSVAWLPVMQQIQGAELWNYMQAVWSYITPAWSVIFLLGAFWTRCTEAGAFWGLMAALVAGIGRMAVHFGYPPPICGGSEADTRPLVVLLINMHFLHFAILLAAITLLVAVCVSLVTAPRTPKELQRVTWWTRKSSELDEATSEREPQHRHIDELLHIEQFEVEHIQIKKHGCRRVVQSWFCGAEQAASIHLTMAELEQQRQQCSNITENPLWSKVCDVNAFIAVAITCALIAYYG